MESGKLSLKNLTNWNNLFMALLGTIGASLLAIAIVHASSVGSYLSITLGAVFIIVTIVVAHNEPDECLVRTQNWSEKVEQFVCYNRRVIMLILMITASPLIGVGVATLASVQYLLYTALSGIALLVISALFILRIPENIDGHMGMAPKKMKTSDKSCPECGSPVGMAKVCPSCGENTGGSKRKRHVGPSRAERETEKWDMPQDEEELSPSFPPGEEVAIDDEQIPEEEG